MLEIKELIEVTLPDPENFLKVKETLSRIGVASKKDKTLYQSCHILHKQGRYFVIHFKQLFLLDGKQSDFTEDDRGRLNVIANLLDEWGLVSLVDRDKSAEPLIPVSQVKIIPHKEKNDWTLVTKYTIGKKRRES
jgi:hypothetical protein